MKAKTWIAVAALVAVAAVGVGIWLIARPKAQATTERFTRHGFAFSYPANWSVRPYVAEGSFSMGLAKVSSQGFIVPCTEDACRRPSGGTLQPGAIFGWWTYQGWARWDFATDAKGTPLTLDDVDMRIDRQSPEDWCRAMRGTTQVTVYVDRHSAGNWVQFTGCEREPTSQVEQQLRALLSTLQIQSG